MALLLGEMLLLLLWLVVIMAYYGDVAAVAGEVGKCCANGQGLRYPDSSGADLECVLLREEASTRVAGTSYELWQIPTTSQQVETKVTPTFCNDSSFPQLDQMVISRHPINVTFKQNGILCMEVFLDQTSGEEFPVSLSCLTRSSRLYHSVRPISRLYQPRFGVCCTKGSVYDVQLKYCVPARSKLPFEIIDHWLWLRVGPPTCGPDHVLVDYSLDPSDLRYDLAHGVYIKLPWRGYSEEILTDSSNACFSAEESSHLIVARICTKIDYCKDNPCIRKCCSEGQINSGCVAPPKYEFGVDFRNHLKSVVPPTFNLTGYGLLVGQPKCLTFAAEPDDEWSIGISGEILLSGYDPFDQEHYCLEFMQNDPEYGRGLLPFYCFTSDRIPTDPNPRNLYEYAMKTVLALMSCCFLSALLLVYVCLPSLQNLHGKTLMCHSASLLVAYACLMINMMIPFHIYDGLKYSIAQISCKCLAYVMLFSFLSAFLWLNVMCFDIWWTFGGMRRGGRWVTSATSASAKRWRFALYCFYAWGLAFLLASLPELAMRLHIGQALDWRIGEDRCWFEYESMGEVVFFIAPITATLLANTAFFVTTAQRCGKVKAEIKRAMASDKDPAARKFHSRRARLALSAKLFIVMGIPWLVDSTSAYVDHYVSVPTWLRGLFIAVDVVNLLQGVWIFILFALKPKVYLALRERLCYRRVGDSREAEAGRRPSYAFRGRKNLEVDVAAAAAANSTSNFTLSTSLEPGSATPS